MLKTISIGFDSYQKALPQMLPNAVEAWEAEWKSAFLSVDVAGSNLAKVILDHGYLDVDSAGGPEYYESALLLLGKVAQSFPDTLTALWTYDLNQAIRKLLILHLPIGQIQAHQFANNQKQVVSGCKFLKEWIAKYKHSQGGDGADQMDDDGEASGSPPAALPSRNPMVQLPEFAETVHLIFKSYLSPQSSVELHIVLLEILMCIGPSEWALVFPEEAQTTGLVKYLLSLKEAQAGACPPALRAATIQTCAYLLSQPQCAQMEDLVNGTFQFVFDTASETNLILQVRNSQATKELCTYLLSSPELYKP